MEIPQHIIDRLLIISPEYSAVDVRGAIEGLYETPINGTSLRHKFCVPRTVVYHWATLAQFAVDVCPHIDRWLDMIGVTRALIK